MDVLGEKRPPFDRRLWMVDRLWRRRAGRAFRIVSQVTEESGKNPAALRSEQHKLRVLPSAVHGRSGNPSPSPLLTSTVKRMDSLLEKKDLALRTPSGPTGSGLWSGSNGAGRSCLGDRSGNDFDARHPVRRRGRGRCEVAQRELEQHYPALGAVEHDPDAIWSDTLAVAREALSPAVSSWSA